MPEVPNLALALNLPPERAIEYFSAKGLKVTGSWRDMAASAHAAAVTVAGVLKAEVLEDIGHALGQALASGETFETFLQKLRPQLKAKGWWGIPHDPETGEVLSGRGMTPHRLRTVFQTNMQSSYMAGRYKSQLENADQRPYWKYVAVLDSRTRPRHRALHGRIFRYDDGVWGVVYPPNGYRCRCQVVALSATEFDEGGGGLSRGEEFLEAREITVGNQAGDTVWVTGYKDPHTGEWFAPDPGFDTNPGAGFGRDIALARRVQELSSREMRTQVWQALNAAPERLAAYHRWANQVLDTRRPGNTAQVLGFIPEVVADFMQAHAETPVRIAAVNEKRLIHADSLKHQEGGIALNRDQIMMLPGIVAAPDEVYFDRKHGHFALVRRLDEGVLFMALETDETMKKVGQIDAFINAYHLPDTANGAGRLSDRQRFVRMAQ